MIPFALGLCDSVGMAICATCARNKDNHSEGFKSLADDITPSIINEPNNNKIRCRSWAPQAFGANR